ncbi:hypothetical protein JQ631_28565 [Bradyrhizobium manausense]|uniref:hypothetical protein n=1 Tax=Bradyrhizobium manausense TaxID=989370 RepID=UPI001BA91DF8|nr:hypothetical protein [Bradyrhizobium manausense]MBR0793045.1 hypothetical protein [Bradyrhizobium manausense]
MTDRLLEWLSYRGRGKVNDLPSHLRPESRPYRVITDLAVLGHIEQHDDVWRVAPPVLASLGDGSEENASAVLCGARTRGLIDRLTTACAVHNATLNRIPQNRRPDCILVNAPTTAELCSVAADTALNWQRDAAFTLLASLPTIASWPRRNCQMVSGRVEGVRRFSKSKLLWVPSTLEESQQADRGLFLIKRDYDSIALLKTATDSQSEIDLAAGRLAVAEGARALHIDFKSQSLRIPWTLSPPVLISRALALCSGQLPEVWRERKELVFRGVTSRMARLATAVLGLRVA